MLKSQIQTDINNALKENNQLKRSVLGMVLTAVKNKEIVKRTQLSKTIKDTAELEKQSGLTDEEIIDAIMGEIKKRKEAVILYTTGNRPELAKKEQAESDILASYLPKQMSREEIIPLAKKIIEKTGASSLKDMGKVIGQIMPEVKGKIDGETVSSVVKELLTK
ncbi:MAG: hypothetical protein CEN90_758 [Parcubacteria group bacterium Licking1014_17]|nr:MAG: hypothetical protein CEN90_758 [Parcubacteria group bacterium Licking1014_17]